MNAPTTTRPHLELILGLICLLAALGWHGYSATRGWELTTLPGHTFRQAQTGHTTQFIVADDNYELAYPTPLLGRPWSIPMEFPLYQWTVAAVHELSDWSLVESARLVSLVSVYAALPAFWLLLVAAGVSRRRAVWGLLPVLLCPVTLFYGRAFLIDTMALALAAWFVVAFVRLLRRPGWVWWLATSLFGTLAGLTKATTLIAAVLACLPLALHAVVQARRTKNGTPRLKPLLYWGLGSAVLPFIATWSWTRFADATKALNPLGQTLRSDNLTGFNFGEGLLDRFSLDRWQMLAGQWDTALMPWWLVLLTLPAVLLLGGRLRGAALLALAVFGGTQVLLPNLYSIHDYYFVAIGGTLALTWALLAIGAWETGGWRRGAGALLLLGIIGAQVHTYRENYAPAIFAGSSGDDLTNQLYRLTEEDEVLIIAGAEWDAYIPYFAQRRALMLPFGSAREPAMWDQTFSLLERNEVAALVLVGDERNHDELIATAGRYFGVSAQPLLKLDRADVFFTERVMAELLPGEGSSNSGNSPVQVFADTMTNRMVETASLSRRQQRLFANMSPLPERFFFEFGPAVLMTPDGALINAHAASELWFHPEDNADEMLIEYGMFDSVWQQDHMRTDGVELSVIRHDAMGGSEVLHQHYLNPRAVEADRGMHVLEIELELQEGDRIQVKADPGPAGEKSFDWFYLRGIEID